MIKTGLRRLGLVICTSCLVLFCERLSAQVPDHPVITEVYVNPPGGSDGPVGRDPANDHQEFIEIYLPTASDLAVDLNKDALNLTVYEVEGDTSSSGYKLVNYRIDLPTFDLDAGNGITPGAVERPSSGVVVIGWVDYVGDPPTDLAGTPSTRVALVNGGVTSATDYLFVAMNGAQFSGTTNFPVPDALSVIQLPGEASSGIIQNGSGAYLLVNRDDPGYVELYDDKDTAHVPPIENADPALADGTVLQVSSLLDGFAGNDDADFDVLAQPVQENPAIDLSAVLPEGGAYSLLIPQIAEDGGHGYLRLFVDVPKTTEDAVPDNEDPAVDAISSYRTVSNLGPWFPTPGRTTSTSSAPELAVADASLQVFDVLAETTGRPGLVGAAVGGNFAMDITATPGSSSDPTSVTFSAGDTVTVTTGQTAAYPSIAATVVASAAHGATATAPVTVSAVNTNGGDPPVVNPIWITTATVHVLNPTTGLDALGQPFQTTVFLAVQPVPAQPGTLNEFLDTDLATFVSDNLGGLVQDTRGLSTLLLDPSTNLNNGFLMQSLIDDFPDDPEWFINWPGPIGRLDLAQTVLQSAEVLSGASTYEESIGDEAVRAIRLNHPDTLTFGGTFTPSEYLYFSSAGGFVGNPTSGLSGAATTRTFELAIFDTNVQDDGSISTGATDDFGIILEVEETEPGSSVVDGEFVFLSLSGGLQGADIDTLDVPPHNNVATLIYLDLDNLHDVLGIRSIEQLFIIDGSGSGELDVIDVFSLNATGLDLEPPDREWPAYAKARYISFVPGNAGRQTALRVTLTNLPDPFGGFNGTKMWVGQPREISENAGVVVPPPYPSFMSANLRCEPYCMDWAAMGLLHVADDEIIPSALYDVQAIDCASDFDNESNYSARLAITTSAWGDVVRNCTTCPCGPPDGVVGIPTDVTAVLDKFKNLGPPFFPCPAVSKARADIDWNIPNQRVDISDVTFCLDAFRGVTYPPLPPAQWPGPDGCP